MKIAIENQYGMTDLTHLGQLLLYAAGCDARIAIWVAPEFGYEHAQALHRLNEWTRDGIDFYGVQVRVIKIGDSKPEPEFRAVVYPGGWNKDITLRSGGMSQEARRFHAFFQPLTAELMQTGFADKLPRQRFGHTGRYFPAPSIASSAMRRLSREGTMLGQPSTSKQETGSGRMRYSTR